MLHACSRRAVVTCALLMAIPFLAANQVDAGLIHADASGRIFGTSRFQTIDGAGPAPVSAAVAYERPNPPGDGGFHASATAAFGSLSTYADFSITNGFGDSFSTGVALFGDNWTFGGQPLDSAGRLRLTLAFDGSASGSATGAIIDAFGRFDFDMNTTDGPDFGQYRSGKKQSANELVTLEMNFRYGREIRVQGQVVSSVRLFGTGLFSGSGTADFSNTAELIGLQVQDSQGGWTTNYDLTTGSGAQYPFQRLPQPVPEPASLLLLSSGMIGVVLLRRRRSSAEVF